MQNRSTGLKLTLINTWTGLPNREQEPSFTGVNLYGTLVTAGGNSFFRPVRLGAIWTFLVFPADRALRGMRRRPQEHNETRYSINDAGHRRREIRRRLAAVSAASAASAACVLAAIAASVAGVAAPPAAFSLH